MGEPLSNYNNVIRATRLLHEPAMFNIGWRRITLSTVGPNTVDILRWFIETYTDYEIDDASFDAIYASALLQHLADPLGALRAGARGQP